MGNHDGQGSTTLDIRQRTKGWKMHRARVETAVLSRLVIGWVNKEGVDAEIDVNSALSLVPREVNWRRCQLELMNCPIDLSVRAKAKASQQFPSFKGQWESGETKLGQTVASDFGRKKSHMDMPRV